MPNLYPMPKCLNNPCVVGGAYNLLALSSKLRVYAVFPYVECCCGRTQAYFYEVSITKTPKYTVIG